MITPTQPIQNLQAQWHTLRDLDRAEAVSTIHKSGVSLRHLAKALNCSEGLLRHLLHALAASPEDLVLARQGQISTWELARRTVTSRTGRATALQETSEAEMAIAVTRGCDAIRRWLAEECLDNPYGVRVVEDARQLLANAGKAGRLPWEQVPPGITADEIIQRCRPKVPKPQDAEEISWYTRWLAIWTCFVIPDPCVRQQSLLLSIKNSSVAE